VSRTRDRNRRDGSGLTNENRGTESHHSAVPHPVMNPKESPVTLFVKDPQRTYKDLLEELKIGFVSRVVGLDKLRTKHKTFEAKRELLREADLFLVDDRVMVEVGKSIGKMWRDAKKCVPQPVSPRFLSRDRN
jgi:ribosome biogenesis protein UTP30